MADLHELKGVIEEFGKTFEDFKSANDERLKQLEEKGAVDVITEEKFSKINAQMDTLEDSNQKFTKEAMEAKTLGDRLDRIETEIKRPSVGITTKDIDSQMKAYDKYLRKGRESLDQMEHKVLTVSNDTGGGYLAPPEFVAEIQKQVIEMSPLRSVARVRTTSNRSIQLPTRTGTFAATFVAETANRPETTGLTYGMEEITAHELYALVDISEQDVEDSAFNMESELASEFAMQFAKAEGTSFVLGANAGTPEGFLTNAGVLAGSTNSGAGAALTTDGLIALYASIKTDYARNGVFVFNRATLGLIRQLKDTAGQYVFQAGFSLNAGTPNSILGQPYIEASDMPSVSAGTKPIAFGDFNRGYVIVDRISLAILRDPFTQATTGTIRYVARRRVGGQVVMSEAIKLQNIATN